MCVDLKIGPILDIFKAINKTLMCFTLNYEFIAF